MYGLVRIANSTNYTASGKVEYEHTFCRDDDYTVTPNTIWSASRRGLCLLTKISALLDTPSGKIQATPYGSHFKIGTTYSQFAIIQMSANSFRVTRVTD